MTSPTRNADYHLGALYAFVTASLLAIQSPFSALAAKSVSATEFVCLTQIALLLSVPLLILGADSRRDFLAVLSLRENGIKLAILLAVGVCGLLFYNIGLSSAPPIITAAVLNLSPFWAGVVAYFVSRKKLPGSTILFYGCFAAAFGGAMLIAWSQLSPKSAPLFKGGFLDVLESRWIYAVPTPIFFALSGSLVGKYFRDRHESAVIAANFVVSALVLIPMTAAMTYFGDHTRTSDQSRLAILLLLVGTLASSAAGRVFYQVSLTTTDNDNGFVTMFFLAIPVLSSLVSLPLSVWIPELRVEMGPMFVVGMALVTAPLLVFSLKTRRS